jgi:hypothetical protein
MQRAGEVLRQIRPTGGPLPEKFQVVKVQKPAREYCKRAARKLAGKPYAPADEVAISVVIDTIHAASASEAHVDLIVAKLLTETPQWPDVTDIRRAADETRDIDIRANPDCGKCGGCGFQSRTIDGYPYSKRCDCWRTVRVPRGSFL